MRTKSKREKMIRKLSIIGLSTLSILMLNSCVKLGPDFTGVDAPPLPKERVNGSSKANADKIAQW